MIGINTKYVIFKKLKRFRDLTDAKNIYFVLE
jgi:hypothetical protein